MAIIFPINSDNTILVSDSDYEYLSNFNWMVNHYGYAVRYDKEKKSILMHRELLGAEEGEEVDHKNHNNLDNRRENIRLCNSKENSANTRKHNDNQCKYKGVSKRKNGKYHMRISNGNNKLSLIFNDEDCAGSAYNYYAKKIFGDFAYLNDVNIEKYVWEKDIVRNGNPNKTSKYKGVTFDNKIGKWRARISEGSKRHHIGYFDSENEAGIAYNKKSIEIFGENAYLNDIDYYYMEIQERPPAKSNMYGTRVVGKRAIIYTKRELEDFEIELGKIVQDAIPKTITTYASMYMRVYQKGRQWLDVDNVFKAIQDSMDATKTIKRGKNEIRICSTGIANDKFFQLIIGERIHCEKSEEQRVEIIITEYKGLFHLVDTVKNHYSVEEDYYKDLFLPEI